MKSRVIVAASAVLLLAVAALVLGVVDLNSASAKVVVYKSPTCGCCGDWIAHMRDAGYEVEVRDMADVTPIKDEHGVGPMLRSCHTAIVGGYVVEGHVPAEHVTRMLAEQPDIKGIAVPGMPIGSPGMDAGYDRSTWQDYDVVSFDEAGATEVYAHITANP